MSLTRSRDMNPDRPGAYLCFDPRDPAQHVHDRATWKLSDNAILISATMLFAAHEGKCPISWEKVAALADLCEDPEFLPQPDMPPRRLATRDETDAMLRSVLLKAEPQGG